MSKCLNYLEYQRISEASFVFFLIVWQYVTSPSSRSLLLTLHSYMRQYVRLRLLRD